jgi:hypothetical protein
MRRALPWLVAALIIGIGATVLLDGLVQFVAQAVAIGILLIGLFGRTDAGYRGREPPAPPGSGPAHPSGMM